MDIYIYMHMQLRMHVSLGEGGGWEVGGPNDAWRVTYSICSYCHLKHHVHFDKLKLNAFFLVSNYDQRYCNEYQYIKVTV